MVVKEIKTIAIQKGIDPRKMKKAEMIRAIQVNEGNFPCYETAADFCDRQDCLWRNDCLKH